MSEMDALSELVLTLQDAMEDYAVKIIELTLAEVGITDAVERERIAAEVQRELNRSR